MPQGIFLFLLYFLLMFDGLLQEQGLSNSRAAIEVWEGTGPDAHNAVVHHLNLSIHRVETLQGMSGPHPELCTARALRKIVHNSRRLHYNKY